MSIVIPDLGGIATQDLVEYIGSGNYKASYINWSRTVNLLRVNAPGWVPEMIFNEEGSPIFKAPVGGMIFIRFRHVTGFALSEVPQAIMDNRNNSIPWDRISSRDVTDTHRRGVCMAAAFHFGLAYELWAKMPLESGYAAKVVDEEEFQKVKAENKAIATPKKEESSTPTESDFIEAGKALGLCDEAIASLKEKIKGNFASGIKTLNGKDKKFVEEMNAKFRPSEEEY